MFGSNLDGVFLPGLELSRRFYVEAVRPILDRNFPGLAHAAALIGFGSEVLGFDDTLSTDHSWGPRVQLFLREEEFCLAPRIERALSHQLPHVFAGYPVNNPTIPEDPGNTRMQLTQDGPVNHLVSCTTVPAFARLLLGMNLNDRMAAADWLILPSQRLLELTAGSVHHDGPGELTALRSRFNFYPHDVWIYLLAAGWRRIGQEEHLMPRANYVGDALGAAIIAGRLARDVMSLCFLMERVYAPYPKWFGTAFAQLRCAAELVPLLEQAVGARDSREREAALSACYEAIARQHNRLSLTPEIPEQVRPFWGRPYQVIHGFDVAQALSSTIKDPEVRAIADQGIMGGLDHISDSTDLRSDCTQFVKLKALYAR